MQHVSPFSHKSGFVLEDNDDFSEPLVELLMLRNCAAHLFRSCSEAINEIDKLPHIDFAICDWRLPDSTSQKVVNKVTSLHPEAAITILTGFEDTKLRQFALDKRVMILRKPIPINTLLVALDII